MPQCLHPTPVYSKARGNISASCGKCASCINKRRSDQTARLAYSVKKSVSAYFITLTYSDEYVPKTSLGTLTLNHLHIREFVKKVQDFQRYHKPPEHWNPIQYKWSSEYGPETFRPHYHIIMTNLTFKTMEAIVELWNMGIVTISVVTEARVHYVSKYLEKNQDIEDLYNADPEMIRESGSWSRGLGNEYLKIAMDETTGRNAHKFWDQLQRKYIYNLRMKMPNGGRFISLPQYYRDRLFNPLDKQNIAAQSWRTLSERDQLNIEKHYREYKYNEDFFTKEERERENFLRKYHDRNKHSKANRYH